MLRHMALDTSNALHEEEDTDEERGVPETQRRSNEAEENASTTKTFEFRENDRLPFCMIQEAIIMILQRTKNENRHCCFPIPIVW
jgi:hypothetical protein